MNRFRNAMIRFMYGRYGMDQLSRSLSIVCLIVLVISLFTKSTMLYAIALVGVFITYFRAFSKNLSRRTVENQMYLRLHYKCIAFYNRHLAIFKDKKTHKIFRCPSCSQKIRVPKNKGKISIKCPKCRIEFIKHT